MWYDFEFQVTFPDGTTRDVWAHVVGLDGAVDDPRVSEVEFFEDRGGRRPVVGRVTYDAAKLEELAIDRYLIWREDP